MVKGKKIQLKIPYLARLSFRIEGEKNSFPDKQKLKDFITTNLVLQKVKGEFLLGLSG